MSDNQKNSPSDFNSNRQIVFCKECSAGNVLYEKFIRCSSHFGMYITCDICHNDIVLDHVNCMEAKGTGPSAASQSASLDNRTGTSKAIRQKCQFRVLKNSDSLSGELERKPMEEEVPPETKMEISMEDADFDCKGQWGNGQQLPWPDDLPFGDSVPLSSTLTDENLRELLKMIRDHPCMHCSCSDRRLLVPVSGDGDLMYCKKCERVYGADDTMNFYDYHEFIDNCRVTACASCGNDNLEKFIFVEVKDQDDDDGKHSTLAIKCMVCESSQQQQQQQEVDISCSCENCGNVDVTKFEISSDASNTLKSICKACGNTKRVSVGSVSGLECKCSAANAQYEFDEFGYIVLVKCEGCGSSMSMDDVSSPESKLPNDGSSRGRTKVSSLDMIRRGDHIAWHQYLGYWHHAIVVEVQFYMVRVIHYNGPAAHKGEIVEDWLTIDPKREPLYRIDYDSRFRNPSETVVQRAKTRVGEHSYNLLTNNCEHFARWCVTGKHCSFQVQSFYRALAQRFAWSVQGRFAQYLVKLGVTVARQPNRLTARVMNKVFSYFARSGSKMASDELNSVAAGSVAARPVATVATGLVVAYEVISATRDIRTAYQQRKEGVIDRDEFLRVTIKRTCEGVGSLAGTAVTLTIPVANSVVGLTLGAVIGKGIGGLVGRNIARVVR